MIPTYNRPQFLMNCLKYIFLQTRLPSEVVIVDASDYWEETYNKVKSAYQMHWETINLVYEPAKVRSSSHQRNQALELCQCDIVFSLDDDMYLYPDAAAIIMEAYDRDVAEEIAMIAGHFTESSPDSVSSEVAAPTAEDIPVATSFSSRVKAWLERQLAMDKHFVPYDQPFCSDPPPASVQDLPRIFPEKLINGGRATFRRKYALQTRWSTTLLYYATHEDSDFSYRMSYCGRLLTAANAKFFHADGNTSQFKRFKVNAIRVMNLMALHRESSPNRLRSSFRLLRSFCSFIGVYLLIDAAQKRFSFPTVRAYLFGIAAIPVFLLYPFNDFRAWYIRRQEIMQKAK